MQFSTEVLRAAGVGPNLGCVVDFGGDQGQLFPDIDAARKVVVDVSDAPTLPGVERASSLDEVDAVPDLVLVAHVLEHLADPSGLMAEIRGAMSIAGHVYIEVPLDQPSIRNWHSRNGYRRWLHRLVRYKPLFVAADFASGVMRQFGRPIPRAGVIKESEHINYFNERSLQALLERLDFTVLTVRAEPDARAGKLRLGRLAMVAAPVRPPA